MSDTRVSWDTTFMDMCKIIAKRSTCIKLQTSAILVSQENNIVSIGYNGSPSKQIHCNEYWNVIAEQDHISLQTLCTDVHFRMYHHEWSLRHELHAEMNALLRCHSPIDNLTLYTLYSPCIQCAKGIVSFANIKKVIYLYPYIRDFEDSMTLLELNNILVEPFTYKNDL